MPSPDSADDRLVLRGLGSLWILGICGLAGILLSGDALLRGRLDVGVPTLLWFALLCWLIFAVLIRPGLIATRSGLTLLNVARRHEVPWGAIDRLSSGYQLRVHLHDGRVLRSWGAPTGIAAPADPMAPDARRPRGRGLAATPAADALIEGWHDRTEERAARSKTPPPAAARGREAVSSWEWPIVAVTGALLVAALAAQLLA